MGGPMKPDKKKKISRELEQIKRMQSINDIMDRSSSENTLLYTSSRENESLNEDTIDKMLNRMAGRESEREIRMVEGMDRGVRSGRPGHRSRPARKAGSARRRPVQRRPSAHRGASPRSRKASARRGHASRARAPKRRASRSGARRRR